MPWSKGRPNGKGTAPKYRTALHRQTRARLISAWRPGDPCARCGLPMLGPTSAIHLGHEDDGIHYRGLEHAECNVKDGARRGRAAQDTTRLTW